MDTTYLGSGIWSESTLVRSAILSVSVPETMITSETRGVARGAMPKRSRSARGPPVCIISMAQQASPNIMYQTDDLRVQLSRSSMRAVSAISGAVLISDTDPLPLCRLALPEGHRALHPLYALQPLQIALPPHVHQADGQDADEDDDLGQREQSLPALHHPFPEHGGHRVDERELHVEDHEDERDDVEANVEVDPGRAARRLAALVGAELPGVRVRWPQQCAEPEHDGAQPEPEQKHHGDPRILKQHRHRPRRGA